MIEKIYTVIHKDESEYLLPFHVEYAFIFTNMSKSATFITNVKTVMN